MSVLVSIIIPNLNNASRLKDCLEAIELQDYPANQREIILVDNGSTDNSVKIARNYAVKILIKDEIKSPYWGRNAGIKEAKGDIIVLIDSNCIPATSGWLSAAVQSIRMHERVIATGPVIFELKSSSGFWEKLDYLYSVIREEDLVKATALPATQLFIPKKIFDEIGLFIPHIRSLGDIEWTGKAFNRNVNFYFQSEAKVYYPPKRLNGFVKKMIRLGGGRKELWIYKGNSVLNINWIWILFKQLMPPSVRFVKEIWYLNKREKTQLNVLSLILGLWLLKLFRAYGMIVKSVYHDDNQKPGIF